MEPQAVFIEAGHGKGLLGFSDTGATGKIGAGKVYERDFAVKIATEVYNILRTKEELKNSILQKVGVETSANIIKKMQFVNMVMRENRLDPSKCFGVAIHMNSGEKGATGFEVWYQKSSKSLEFANKIAISWHEYGILPTRPKPINNSKDGRFGRFYIDDTLANYVIIETGFISNESDASIILNNIPRVAEAIAHGILEYFRKH